MKQIKEIITVSMRSGRKKINRNNRNFQFEIFGYDFMLDSNFNTFLIEINSNPGIEISSPWIQIIIPRMLDDALRLTVDKVFEPIYDFKKNYKGDYTKEQKKVLINSKIEYDFNAVEPNIIKDSSSIHSSTFSKTSEKPISNSNNNILNINLELDEFDKKLIEKEIKINCDKNENEKKLNDEELNNNNINNNKNIDNNNQEDIKNIEENKDVKLNKKNKLKYISPFPVPGYSLDENLWDFVCDLNEEDPFEIPKEKISKENDSYTGIKHLLKRKKKSKKNEKEEKNKNNNGNKNKK